MENYSTCRGGLPSFGLPREQTVSIASINYGFMPASMGGGPVLWAQLRFPPHDFGTGAGLRVGRTVYLGSTSGHLRFPDQPFVVTDIQGTRVALYPANDDGSVAVDGLRATLFDSDPETLVPYRPALTRGRSYRPNTHPNSPAYGSSAGTSPVEWWYPWSHSWHFGNSTRDRTDWQAHPFRDFIFGVGSDVAFLHWVA